MVLLYLFSAVKRKAVIWSQNKKIYWNNTFQNDQDTTELFLYIEEFLFLTLFPHETLSENYFYGTECFSFYCSSGDELALSQQRCYYPE